MCNVVETLCKVPKRRLRFVSRSAKTELWCTLCSKAQGVTFDSDHFDTRLWGARAGVFNKERYIFCICWTVRHLKFVSPAHVVLGGAQICHFSVIFFLPVLGKWSWESLTAFASNKISFLHWHFLPFCLVKQAFRSIFVTAQGHSTAPIREQHVHLHFRCCDAMRTSLCLDANSRWQVETIPRSLRCFSANITGQEWIGLCNHQSRLVRDQNSIQHFHSHVINMFR